MLRFILVFFVFFSVLFGSRIYCNMVVIKRPQLLLCNKWPARCKNSRVNIYAQIRTIISWAHYLLFCKDAIEGLRLTFVLIVYGSKDGSNQICICTTAQKIDFLSRSFFHKVLNIPCPSSAHLLHILPTLIMLSARSEPLSTG